MDVLQLVIFTIVGFIITKVDIARHEIPGEDEIITATRIEIMTSRCLMLITMIILLIIGVAFELKPLLNIVTGLVWGTLLKIIYSEVTSEF